MFQELFWEKKSDKDVWLIALSAVLWLEQPAS